MALLLVKAGDYSLFISFESLREEYLHLVGKMIDRIEVYEREIRRLYGAGNGVYASFVFGHDYGVQCLT